MLPGHTVESGQVLNIMVHRYKCIRVEIYFPKQYGFIPCQTTNNFLSAATVQFSRFARREREREKDWKNSKKRNTPNTFLCTNVTEYNFCFRFIFHFCFLFFNFFFFPDTPRYVLINNVDPLQYAVTVEWWFSSSYIWDDLISMLIILYTLNT